MKVVKVALGISEAIRHSARSVKNVEIEPRRKFKTSFLVL